MTGRATVAAAGALLLSACVERVTGPLHAPADPTEVYAAVRQREQSVRTLRARFVAEFVTQGSESPSRRASGVLLVKKPDRFRLRLLSPFGLTVFDYTSCGEHARVVLPLEGKQLADDQIGSVPFSPALLRQHFLRGADASATCAPEARDAHVVVGCRGVNGALLSVSIIEGSTGRVRRELSRFVEGEHPQFVTEYDDYRRVGEMELPFAIRLSSELQTLRVAITSYEVNAPLPDSLFDSGGGS